MSSRDEDETREEKSSDQSWKERALREKEKLAEELAAAPGGSHPEIPPASFAGLVEELSMRVLLCLGQFADPRSGEAFVDLPAARYVIDTLEVLAAKTKGNLDAEEENYLSESLYRLRLAYVDVARMIGEELERQGGGSRILTPDDVAAAPQKPKDSGSKGGPTESGAGPGPRIII